ncbi:MAG: hypothetical protein ABJH45_12565 [Paracoccaceae bacterium]
MTLEQIHARMEAASNRLVDLQAELERKDALLRSGRDVNGDGTFDEGDSDAVDRVRTRCETLRGRIDGLLQQYILAEAEANGTPVEIIDFEDEGSFVQGDTHRILFSSGKNDFATQIESYRVNMRESLGFLVRRMSETGDDGPGFPKNEIVSLVKTALTASNPPLATALGVANTMLDLAVKSYENSLPPVPSLLDVEQNWRQAIDALNRSAADDTFDALVAQFKAHNQMDSDELYVYSSHIPDWEALTGSFVEGDVLPSSPKINRSFMAYVISQMPDSPYDLDMSSGEVTVRMDFDMDSNSFAFSSGTMDDITDEVKKGLAAFPALFGADRVVSLPTDIRFIVRGSGWSDGVYCEIYRRSKVSGDTSFEMMPRAIGADTSLEEQSTMFQIFMNRRIYNTVSVSEIL